MLKVSMTEVFKNLKIDKKNSSQAPQPWKRRGLQCQPFNWLGTEAIFMASSQKKLRI